MKTITPEDLQQQHEMAANSPRLRTHLNFHPDICDPVQRLAVTMAPGTYVRPHRHPHTFELLFSLSGRFVVLTFNDYGTVTRRLVLGDECKTLEMDPGTWHTVLPLGHGGTIFEVKHGGYQPVAEHDFAPWAPAEGQPGTAEMLAWYARAGVGDCGIYR